MIDFNVFCSVWYMNGCSMTVLQEICLKYMACIPGF